MWVHACVRACMWVMFDNLGLLMNIHVHLGRVKSGTHTVKTEMFGNENQKEGRHKDTLWP